MLVAVPLGFLNMLFRYHGAARTMKSRAVDQTGLKGLELLAGNDMIVNVDNHDAILSMRLGLLPIRDRQRAARQRRKDWKIGVTGVLVRTDRPILHYSTPSLHWVKIGRHTSELQSQSNLVCRLLLEKKKKI